MPEADCCPHCGDDFPPEDAVPLWDGRTYCEPCVQAASPLLAEVACTFARFEEAAPISARELWRTALWLESWGFLFLGVCLVANALLLNWALAAPAKFEILFGVVVATLQLPLLVRHARRMLPTASVAQGEARCWRGGHRNSHLRAAPLAGLRWQRGKSKHDSELKNTLVRRHEVVLLCFPRTSRWWPFGSVRYACGWTPQTMEIWQAFLTLAEVPQARPLLWRRIVQRRWPDGSLDSDEPWATSSARRSSSGRCG